MKKYFSKEVKIAISVIVSAVILYFGIEFLKGINLMHPSNYYYIRYDNEKETKAVLEEKQKEYQATDRTEKEKAETDFQKEKIDNLYAGVCKNCGNLEFLLTKIQDLGTQSEKMEKQSEQMTKSLTDLEEQLASGGNLETKENSLIMRLQHSQYPPISASLHSQSIPLQSPSESIPSNASLHYFRSLPVLSPVGWKHGE